MELRFDKNKMKTVMENYYKKYEDFEGNITIGCKMGYVGYGMSEHQDAVVSIKITGTLDVMGEKVPMTRVVDEEEVINVFKTVLGASGYTVSDVSFDSGVKQTCEGYGMAEHTVEKPYFNGVIVNVREKQLVRH